MATKITYPTEIEEFGKLYVLLRYLGTAYNNGNEEEYFARLRVALLIGLEGLKEPIKMDILKKALNDPIIYKEIEKAISTGIDSDNCRRFEIIDFVTSVTKQYRILYAALNLVKFPYGKEFTTIYGNFAIQSTNSGEKREKLLSIRTIAVEKLIEQTEKSMTDIDKEEGMGIDEKKKRKTELADRFQRNLMFVTTYTMSDEILNKLLLKMNFHKRGSFYSFYKHLVLIDNCKNNDEDYVQKERLEQRWQVVHWIMTSKDKAFIKEAFSAVFTIENNIKILNSILAFLDLLEDEGGEVEKIELVIPTSSLTSSLNREIYNNHQRKRKGLHEGSSKRVESKKINKEECECLAKNIKQLEIEEIVNKASNDKELTRLVEVTMSALASGKIKKSEAEKIRDNVCKYNPSIAREIKPDIKDLAEDIKLLGIETTVRNAMHSNKLPLLVEITISAIAYEKITKEQAEEIRDNIRKYNGIIAQEIKTDIVEGVCSADIIAEELVTPEQLEKFRLIAQEIIASREESATLEQLGKFRKLSQKIIESRTEKS